jgi:non-specific serine/threonine protein kinase
MIGKVINDRYRLDAELGHGGMGAVYKGHDQELERDVAIKVLNQALFGKKERDQLIHEAKVIARLKHPNIVSVHDVGEYENSPFFVMEFIEGGSLRDIQPSDLDEIIHICIQICKGLEHAHENGIIHRDLKPENVLLEKDGRVKLVDFGIARSDVTRFTSAGNITGTVNYLAPEIAKGEDVDGRADLYSLGVMLYELTTGQLPLTADSLVAVISKHLFEEPVPPNETNPDLPLNINDLILSLMSKDPDERPHSARELLQILEASEFGLIYEKTAEITSRTPTTDASPSHNLTAQPSTFIGREEELTQIGELLADTNCRLVTLVGIGGIGKTRLATQSAIKELDNHTDGVWLVELASLTEVDFLPQQVASVLGVSAQEAREGYSETDVLVDYLREKSLLLVIDNCEHLVEACAEFAEVLLKGCPKVKLLATSREDLRIPGETVFHVSPMELPPDETSVDTLETYEAIQLFIERAAASRQGFKLTRENGEALAQICRQLDGIPLAIELAAARVKVITPEQIAERLDDRFKLLTSGSRTALPRHQTLKATMDWSYSLLSEPEGALLRQLSVFSGGWILEAAEAVAQFGKDSNGDVLELLSQLVDKSLVLVEEGEHSVRYGMLETVRQYGKNKLSKPGEIMAVRQRHMEYFVQLAEQADEGMRDSRQINSIEVLENEHDNLRGALRWSLDNGDPDHAFRLVGALGWFWFVRGYWKDAWVWLEQSLALNMDSDPLLRAKATYRAGGLEIIRGKLKRTTELVEEALVTTRENDDSEGTAWCLNLLGQAGTWGYKNYDEAAAHLSESIELFSMLENEWGVAWSLRYLGQIKEVLGDYEGGILLQKDALQRFEDIGDSWNSAHSLYLMGGSMYQHGDFEGAKWAYEQSLAKCEIVEDKVMEAHALKGLAQLAIQKNDLKQAEKLSLNALEDLQKIGDEHCTAGALRDLGDIALRQGNFKRATMYFRKSLLGYEALGNEIPIALTIQRFAALAESTGREEEAARLLAAVDALISEDAWQSFPIFKDEHENLVASTQQNLGDLTFDQLSAEGAEMSLEQAVAYAIKEIRVD